MLQEPMPAGEIVQLTEQPVNTDSSNDFSTLDVATLPKEPILPSSNDATRPATLTLETSPINDATPLPVLTAETPPTLHSTSSSSSFVEDEAAEEQDGSAATLSQLEILIPADGNCLYASILIGYLWSDLSSPVIFAEKLTKLIGHSDQSEKLRRFMIPIMTAPQNVEKLKTPYFQGYIALFKSHMQIEHQGWGGAPEIQILANRLQIAIQEKIDTQGSAYIDSDVTEPTVVTDNNSHIELLTLLRTQAIAAEVCNPDHDPVTQLGCEASAAEIANPQHFRILVPVSLLQLDNIQKSLYETGSDALPWTIHRTDEGDIYATNYFRYMVVEFHPYSIWRDMAFHHFLLQRINDLGDNPIQFVQKFLASGTEQYPNKRSQAFTQALEYSLYRHYGMEGLLPDDAQFISRLFSLPQQTTPTLVWFNHMIQDFISTNPRGLWRAHQQGYIHFQDMRLRHGSMKTDITNDIKNMHEDIIQITMRLLIQLLYVCLDIFRDHSLLSGIGFNEDEKNFMAHIRISEEQQKIIRSALLGNTDETHDIFHVREAKIEQNKTEAGLIIVSSIQHKKLKPDHAQQYASPKEASTAFIKDMKALAEANSRYHESDDIIVFLKELRNIIIGKDKRRQLLGIGFKGTYFESTRDIVDDETAIYLCFTEQFRIAGSIFLNYVGWQLRQILSKHYGRRIHVRVPSAPDVNDRLMCHYVMEHIWQAIMNTPETVSAELARKLRTFIVSELDSFLSQNEKSPKTLIVQQEMASYMGLLREPMLDQLTGILDHYEANPECGMPLEVDIDTFRKFGEFILNKKIYHCVEMQLIPIIHGGLIFPIILNPIDAAHSMVSFHLRPFVLEGNENSTYQFTVAHPCDRFCQPASVAYDIMAEIQAQFSEYRGFIGAGVTYPQPQRQLLSFTDEEREMILSFFELLDSYLEERYKIYNGIYEAQQATATASHSDKPSQADVDTTTMHSAKASQSKAKKILTGFGANRLNRSSLFSTPSSRCIIDSFSGSDDTSTSDGDERSNDDSHRRTEPTSEGSTSSEDSTSADESSSSSDEEEGCARKGKFW